MKRKFIALALAFTLAFGFTGCMDDWDEEVTEETGDDSSDGEKTEDKGDGDSQTASADETSVDETDGEIGEDSDMTRGLSLNVSRDTGKLNITRASGSRKADIGDKGVWTVFVYLCGTDLESDGGMGTDDLNEMLDCGAGDNVRFVVQTGGTRTWNNDLIKSNKIQRYVVSDGDIELVDKQSLANMGKSGTLADFLKWGTANYNSEHMGVVLWNHGGGSITGVCFDETKDNDSLSLKELDEAFNANFKKTGRKFDFVGFDACLMGTIECANILATYSNYMYGSEELEPGSGWDYSAIGKFLGKNPKADGAELGKVVCDSFLAACKAMDDDDLTTLSVIDLAKVDDLLVSFNDFAKGMYEAGEDQSKLTEMIRGITAADNFGGNNKSEGYTNMVDLGGIISACSDYASGADAALKALEKAVVYKVSGSAHKKASGLSAYYPLSIEGSEELSIFTEICPSPYYLSFIDRMNQSGAGLLENGEYDDDSWFDEDGDWFWGLFDFEEDDYWDYMDDYEVTGESPYITFEQEPAINDNGYYSFVLDDEGYEYTASVSALVYEITEDGAAMMELGETTDVYSDWETGSFEDNFDGYWLSLPDGQNLATYIVEETEDYVIYTSPVMVNGEDTNLRLKQSYDDYSVKVEGTWDGIDENGAAAKKIKKLQSGDVIVPLYYAYDLDTYEEFQYEGYKFKVSGKAKVDYSLMDIGDFMYSFCINDIFGDYYVSDPVVFYVDEDGEVTFEE